MPRYYTPKPGAKVYKHYTENQLAQAVMEQFLNSIHKT